MIAPFVPIGGRILVFVYPEEQKTSGGLILVDPPEARTSRGMVVDHGKGNRNSRGEIIPFAVKIGEEVIFKKHTGTIVMVNNQPHCVLKEEDIMATYGSQQ